MDNRYEVFCLADGQFHEIPDRLSASRPGQPSSVPLYEVARRELPPGWRRFVSGDWMHINPVGADGVPLPGRADFGYACAWYRR
ncbi:hypothetical protein [Streptomyces enissocaesilis]|uniref:Uncharacterized protein n=1 Tax=Streptomyces enissocaesilis TaxID=332589 RepID=A0ABN3WVJ0_9ACTN